MGDQSDTEAHRVWLQHLARYAHNLIMETMANPALTEPAVASTPNFAESVDSNDRITESATHHVPSTMPRTAEKQKTNASGSGKFQLFPNGDVSFSILKEDYQSSPVFGWKMFTHNSKELKAGICIYRCCLGVWICPSCEFTRPPCQPTKKRRHGLPPPTKDKCPQHSNEDLIHIKCSCSMTILDVGQS
jgi:hypothetical protein